MKSNLSEVSLSDLLGFVIVSLTRHWRLLFSVALVLAVATGVVVSLRKGTYKADAFIDSGFRYFAVDGLPAPAEGPNELLNDLIGGRIMMDLKKEGFFAPHEKRDPHLDAELLKDPHDLRQLPYFTILMTCQSNDRDYVERMRATILKLLMARYKARTDFIHEDFAQQAQRVLEKRDKLEASLNRLDEKNLKRIQWYEKRIAAYDAKKPIDVPLTPDSINDARKIVADYATQRKPMVTEKEYLDADLNRFQAILPLVLPFRTTEIPITYSKPSVLSGIGAVILVPSICFFLLLLALTTWDAVAAEITRGKKTVTSS